MSRLVLQRGTYAETGVRSMRPFPNRSGSLQQSILCKHLPYTLTGAFPKSVEPVVLPAKYSFLQIFKAFLGNKFSFYFFFTAFRY
jgi:hypothetical protein